MQGRADHHFRQAEEIPQAHPSVEQVGTGKAQLAEEQRCGRSEGHCNNLEWTHPMEGEAEQCWESDRLRNPTNQLSVLGLQRASSVVGMNMC